MCAQQVDRIRGIKTFPSLVKYLRDELDWPIETNDFNDLTFDYEPDELGIDKKNAAKIQEIKQLRPLAPNQPFGIFFLKFEPKQLPVVVLRRILSQLVIKKRATGKRADQPAWHLNDLLFISSYGDQAQRQITFAQFTQDRATGDLPMLRVLGWDDADTVLHLEHTHQTLKDKLRWPGDESDTDSWRSDWSSAFELRHREVITTSKQLALKLAELARRIRNRAQKVLAVETERGPVRKLYKAFQEALIHDLTEDDFADMYAQTIAYGLLAARISRPAGLVADNVVDVIPNTNPFLKELLETFLHVGGRKNGFDFDELGVNDVVETLRDANMEAVLRDFGDRNPQEDPVIHFYELFLKEYDAKKRMQRGVFYTPRPVVSYIVRSVDELLRTEFGLEDGLADTTTWGEMLKRFPDLKLPVLVPRDPTDEDSEDVLLSPDTPFVQILDPATGTGTFLVEVIDIINKTLTEQWKAKGHGEKKILTLWNEYVPKHLLPRLHGYELLMAPYAIAHLKIGLKLYETGYRFEDEERARVYLTNALEPPSDKQLRTQLIPALANESKAVNDIKRTCRFTIVIGNPPYSNFGRLNDNPWIINLLRNYKLGLNERKINLDDDYVKFIRFAQHLVGQADLGLWSFISNNSYLDGLTHRKMREHLMETYSQIRVVDLHGNVLAQEKAQDGSADANVFDIQQGVGISVGVRWKRSDCGVYYSSLSGSRSLKNDCLMSCTASTLARKQLTPLEPHFLFVDRESLHDDEYRGFVSVVDIFTTIAYGIQTKQDRLFVDFDEETLRARVHRVIEDTNTLGVAVAQRLHNLGISSGWSPERLLGLTFDATCIRQILYRPFDVRWIYYHPRALGRARFDTMRHLLWPNVGLILMRQVFQDFEVYSHFGMSPHVIDERTFYSNRGGTYLFPAFKYLEPGQIWSRVEEAGGQDKESNVSPRFRKMLLRSELAAARSQANSENNEATTIDSMDYIFAVLHSVTYRQRYKDQLKSDFPRIPMPRNGALAEELRRIGGELVALYLLESLRLNNVLSIFSGPKNVEVKRVGWSDDTVWLDAAATKKGQPAKPGTIGFHGVPEEVWNFHIGGYQVCEKWLKDRKGRTLSKADIEHYQKIVVALSETIRLMAEIDKVIDAHGGWPGAFKTE